jgi:LPS sulfotransferase NodH
VPTFELLFLDNLYAQIRDAEAGWEAFFEEVGAQPLCLWYEEVASNLESALNSILMWLGVPCPSRLPLSGLQHQLQATSLNAEWEARFRAARPDA